MIDLTPDEAVVVPVVLEMGAAWSDNIQVTDADDVPVNLSTYTAKQQFRRSVNDATVILELSTANGGITVDSSGNLARHITSAQTAALPPDTTLVYDLFIYTGGEGEPLLQGEAKVKKMVTR